jgi:hypothetical protein
VVTRERFIEGAEQRAALVQGKGLPVPRLVQSSCQELGRAYVLGTAVWCLPLPTGESLTLTEDFLVDQTGADWICQAYLLRGDLPGLLAARS